MIKFLFKNTIYSIIFSTICIWVILRINGYNDPFYKRFTTPPQKSLIIGNSRAAQGIQPQVLNNKLNRDDLYNYSFTLLHSPYGPSYYHSIIKKLNPFTRNGIFIVTVDPWSISSNCTNPNDTTSYRELGLCVNKVKYPNKKPNFDYILNCYDGHFFNLLTQTEKKTYLHNNGWLEVNVNMDSVAVVNRTNTKIYTYKNNNLPFYNYSSIRMEYLGKIVEKLKKHGKVYIVRLPVCKEILMIDNLVVDNFDQKMHNLANSKKVPYLNLTNLQDNLDFTDGNHLYKSSGMIVSNKIADFINSNP